MAKMRAEFLVCLALFCAACATAAEGDAVPVILLTGFEPFGGAKINESWETIKTFQGKTVGGHRIETERLPVVYDEMDAPLQAAIDKHKPAIMICFGVGTDVVTLETTARNGYHPQHPRDNKDRTPPRKQILPGAPAEIPTALPADAILAALKTAKIGAVHSQDAGGYLCNECFYRLMSRKNPPPLRGFIHVPPYGKVDPAGGTFDAEKLCKAVDAILLAVTAAKK